MAQEHPLPLMLLEGVGAVGAFLGTGGLAVRELSPDEAATHAKVAALGFEAPVEPFLQFITPAVLALPGVRCYLGEAHGEAVTTGIGIQVGPFVGIFDIATPPAHRGRGYGAAITARAVTDGLAAGAQWSWLQSSAGGHSVYGRPGFRDIETWSVWLSAVDNTAPMPPGLA